MSNIVDISRNYDGVRVVEATCDDVICRNGFGKCKTPKPRLLNAIVDVTIFELCTPILQLIMGLVKGLGELHRGLRDVKESLPSSGVIRGRSETRLKFAT